MARARAVENDPNQQAFYLSDGTTAGTQRITPSAAMPQAAFPPYLRVAGQALIAGDATNTWRIDAATAQVTALGRPLEMLASGDVAELGGALIGAQPEVPSTTISEVWRSDGTSSGTRLLHDLRTATRGALTDSTGPSLALGNVLLFGDVIDRPIEFPLGRRALWRTDGSPEGTWALPSSVYGGGSVEQVQKLGNQVIFSADTVPRSGVRQLYRTRSDLLETTPLAATTLAGSEYLRSVGDNNTAAMFSCGTPGGLGLDCEFFESVMVPQVIIDGFLGLDPSQDELRPAPNLPRDWPSVTINRINWRGTLMEFTATRPESATVEATPVPPQKWKSDTDEPEQ